MPLYEYVCQECDHPFETLVRTSTEKVNCPQCKSEKVERTLSVPARPLSVTASPGACKSSGPPCSPMCNRWPAS
jgi:putative FmdB family regulatory protein